MRPRLPFSASTVLVLALLAGGFVCAAARRPLLARIFPPELPGPVALWVCDRDGGAVVGLDAEHLIASRVAVPSPTGVVACGDGRLWVASAVHDDPQGEHELRLLTAGGRRLGSYATGPLLDLAACGPAGVVALERVGPRSVRAFALPEPGGECELEDLPGAVCVAGDRSGGALIGTSAGLVIAYRGIGTAGFPSPGPRRRLAERVVNLAAGPAPGSWWVLVEEAGGAGYVDLVDDELEVRWHAPLAGAGRGLIPVPGREQVWVVTAGGRGVQRLGPGGVAEVPWTRLPMRVGDAGVGTADGGVALLAPGALLVLDGAGRPGPPGQGGFRFLVAACAVEARAPP